jgi:hypothetical protein
MNNKYDIKIQKNHPGWIPIPIPSHLQPEEKMLKSSTMT